jgi:hypothetical protein
MKICPSCQSQYSDDTLNFCLQDGTPLAAPQSAPTVSFTEQETVVAARPTAQPVAGYPRPTSPAFDVQASRPKFLIAAVIFLTFVLLVFIGVGLWIVYTGGNPYSRTNPMLANANTNGPVTSSKPKTPEVAANKPANAANTNSNANVTETAKLKTEVTDRIDAWRAGIESVDLERFMQNYAESVDYYNGRGTTRAAVRDDKQRAFAKFDAMKMTITNIKVTIGPGDGKAVAVFDKEWVFTNAAGDRNAGKVSQQLNLEKIDGKWLITLEKDLRVIERPN